MAELNEAYGTLTEELLAQLREVVGAENFLVGSAISEDYSHDEMPIYGSSMPQCVCQPATTEEVAAIMKLCYEHTIPVTVRGAGTGLVGGCTPIHGGITLSTMRMNQIIEYDLNNLYVRVQPGVRLCDLATNALERGFMYPPDPGEKTGSLGGNVSTNAGGMRAVKYGTTRDYVLALTAVLPTGKVVQVSRPVEKTSSGYSLLHLIVGSEGTLAVITEITLKLVAKPQVEVSFILPFENLQAATAATPGIKRAGLDPQSIEFMERDIVDSSAAYLGKTVFPTQVNGREAGAYLLLTLEGTSHEEIMQRAETLFAIADEAGAYDVLVVDHASQKEDVWAARSSFLTVIESEAELLDEMDVVVPVDAITEFLDYVHSVGEAQGMRIRSFGHVGDGNLHVYCAGNGVPRDEFMAKAQVVMDAAYAKCAQLNGAVSGEHGIGMAKREYLHASVGPEQVALMRGIKAVFDPKNILNPGKVV